MTGVVDADTIRALVSSFQADAGLKVTGGMDADAIRPLVSSFQADAGLKITRRIGCRHDQGASDGWKALIVEPLKFIRCGASVFRRKTAIVVVLLSMLVELVEEQPRRPEHWSGQRAARRLLGSDGDGRDRRHRRLIGTAKHLAYELPPRLSLRLVRPEECSGAGMR